ncbi:MAG: hypothetical protein RR563_09160 [Acinetobacter sp.]
MRKKKYTKQQFYRRLEAQNAKTVNNKVFSVLAFKNCFERFSKSSAELVNSMNKLSVKLSEAIKNMPNKQGMDVYLGGKYIGKATSIDIKIS